MKNFKSHITEDTRSDLVAAVQKNKNLKFKVKQAPKHTDTLSVSDSEMMGATVADVTKTIKWIESLGFKKGNDRSNPSKGVYNLNFTHKTDKQVLVRLVAEFGKKSKTRMTARWFWVSP